MRASIVPFLCAALLVSASSFAADLSGRDLVVVIARVPGQVGSDWRTDLVLANVRQIGNVPPVDITLTFFRSGGEPLTATLQLATFATATIEDVVSTTFHLTSGSGVLRITAPADSLIAGRAFVYNNAAAGQIGQSVPAVPLDALTNRHTLPALSGVAGRRTNIGVANPWSIPMVAVFVLFDVNGRFLGASVIKTLPPQSLTQFDLFAELKVAPRASATAVVSATYPVYAYASTIRADNGAATFILGSGISSADEDFGSPLCLAPAPLIRFYPNAPGWIGIFKPDVDAAAALAALRAKYGDSLLQPYPAIGTFIAPQLSAEQLAGLRCEPALLEIRQNALSFSGGGDSLHH
ncbi:MAG TPA: hypothetical protein VLC46_18135 [Thermoanaerobaculia bacterium]|jgi:hypothetical protein|nr:hypothetical protein [Thermoanaerobaculia bacterium]